MRLVFAGTPETALPAVEAITASSHELLAVVTRPDVKTGRGRKLRRCAVAAWADDKGVEVLTPSKPGDESFLRRLTRLAPDCVPVVAYGALVPESALRVPAQGWVNLHFSLLPAWRGAAPVQRAVLAGDEITGCSVFQLETGLDTGPVYASLTEPIADTDTGGDLLGRLADSGAELLVKVLDAMESGQARAVAQPSDGVSLAPKITGDDARIRWHEPAFAVDRRIRAVTPTPGAWTTWDEKRVRLGPVTVDSSGPQLSPGQVTVAKNTVHVGTVTNPVSIDWIQPPGKKPMPASAWIRGLRDAEEIVFR